MSGGDVMRIREAAKMLGVSVDTVYLWCAGGMVPAFRQSARGPWMFSRAALLEWVQERSRANLLRPAADGGAR